MDCEHGLKTKSRHRIKLDIMVAQVVFVLTTIGAVNEEKVGPIMIFDIWYSKIVFSIMMT